MKKIITVSICVLLIFALAMPAFAEGATSFYIAPSANSAYRGDEIVVTVSVSGDNVFQSAGVILSFDASVFEMVGGSLSNGLAGSFDPTRGFAIINTSGNVYAGEIGTFTLRIKDDAPFSVGNITGTASAKNGNTSFETNINLATVLVKCNHEYDNNCDTECNVCGDTRQVNHQWDAGKVTHEPTCMSTGVRVYTCTLCGETEAEIIHARSHTYDNECDTECNNGCGTTREAKHDYSSKWTSDGTNHWHECAVCGDKADVTAHTPGPEATEWSSQTCTVCGKVLKEALGHTHKYGSEWIYDDMGHWYECSGCEELKDYSDHRYDNACDPDCNDCGSVRQIHHEYGHNMWFDASGHWQECIVCSEKTSPEPHEPGPEATEESAQVCTICGYELAPALSHTHEYGEDWYWDGTGHWQVCSCGIATVREDHNWGEPIITRQPTAEEEGEATYICLSCDAEKKEPIPAEAPTETTQPTQPNQGGTAEPEPKEFPVWILIVAGCVLVLGFIIFMIVGAILGQKKTGKFSEK